MHTNPAGIRESMRISTLEEKIKTKIILINGQYNKDLKG